MERISNFSKNYQVIDIFLQGRKLSQAAALTIIRWSTGKNEVANISFFVVVNFPPAFSSFFLSAVSFSYRKSTGIRKTYELKFYQSTQNPELKKGLRCSGSKIW